MRIDYKICLLAYKALNFGQPEYLAELLQHHEAIRPLRSDAKYLLKEPIIAQANYSNRCFTYCAPRIYNKLPENIKTAQTIEIFKSRLKTFLFTQAYDMNNKCISMNYRT